MAKPRPKAPSKKAAAPSRKPAPAKKAAPKRKAKPALKPAPAKKAAPKRKAEPVRKTAPAKKAAPKRKAEPVRKTAPAKKAAPKRTAKPVRKTAPVKKAAPKRKAEPVRKTAPAKKTAPARKAAAVRKAAAAPVRKAVRKPEPARKAEPIKKTEPVRKPKPKTKPAADDPALVAFGKALQVFHQKNWAQAAELFEQALAESDRLDLSARARQYLASCRQCLAEAGGPKSKKKDEDRDPFLRAVFERNRGNLPAALDLCRKEGRDEKDERFAYLAASILAAEGRLDDAVQALSRAIELNPKNRIHAFHDSDFAELRKDRDQRQLFGLS